MNVRQAAFIGVGAMVGAGIFSLLGAAGEVAGAAVWLSFLIAGVIAMLQGYSFAKFGARYPSAGGLLEYVRQGYGDGHFTGIIAWLLLATNAIITAMVAVSFGSYASEAVADGSTTWVKLFAVLIVVVMSLLNIVGSQAVARAQTVIVYVVLGILTLFAVATLADLDPDLLAFSNYPSISDIVSSVALTFFAFLGFGVITFTAKDLADPSTPIATRDVPRTGHRDGDLHRRRVGRVRNTHGRRSNRFRRYGARGCGGAGARSGRLLADERDRAVRDCGCDECRALPRRGSVRGDGSDPAVSPGARTAICQPAPAGLVLTAAVAIVLAVGFDLSSIASIGSAIALLVFALVTTGHLRVRSETGASTGLLLLGDRHDDDRASDVRRSPRWPTNPRLPSTIVAILLLSVVLDFAWKRSRDRAFG